MCTKMHISLTWVNIFFSKASVLLFPSFYNWQFIINNQYREISGVICVHLKEFSIYNINV